MTNKEKPAKCPRLLWGYAFGVTLSFAMVLVFSGAAPRLSVASLPSLGDFDDHSEDIIIFPAEAFGRAGVKPKQSTFIAKYEKYFEDNPASFEPLEEYPANYFWRRYERSAGLLDLAFKSHKSGIVSNAGCTASIIAKTYLLTANHCIDQAGYDLAGVEFHIGFLNEDGAGRRFPVSKTPIEFSKQLDYAVLEVDFGTELAGGDISQGMKAVPTPLGEYERPEIEPVRLSNYTPDENERLFIVHHPMKEPMVVTSHTCLSLTNPDDVAEAPTGTNENVDWGNRPQMSIRHLCDTLIGSSGAPVMTLDRNAVVAIHTDGTTARKATRRNANRATRIDRIAEFSRQTDTKIIAQLIEPKPLTSGEREAMLRFVGQSQRAYDNGDYSLAMRLAFASLENLDEETINSIDAREAFSALFRSMQKNSLIADRKAHDSGIWQVVLSPDQKKYVTAASDGTVKIWDSSNGVLDRTLIGHTSIVHGVSFFPDGQRLATVSGDNTVRVWDTISGVLLHTLSQDILQDPWSVDVSPDGEKLVVGTVGKTLVFSTATFEPLIDVNNEDYRDAYRVRYSPDGMQFIAAHGNGEAVVREALTGVETVRLTTDASALSEAVYSTDATRIFTAGANGMISIWDAKSGTLQRQFRAHASEIFSLEYLASTTTDLLVSASSDRTLKIWNASTTSNIASFSGHSGIVTSAAFYGEKDSQVISSSTDGTVKIWQTQNSGEFYPIPDTGSAFRTLLAPDGDKAVFIFDRTDIQICNWKTVACFLIDVGTVAMPLVDLSADGAKALFLDVATESISAWNTENGKLLFSMPLLESDEDTEIKVGNFFSERSPMPRIENAAARLASHGESIEWSPDERYFAFGDGFGEVAVFDLHSGKLIAEIDWYDSVERQGLGALDWSSNSSVLAIAPGQGPIALLEFDAKGSGKVSSLPEISDIAALSWSPVDDSLVAISRRNTIHIYDAKFQSLITRTYSENVSRPIISWSPNGELIAVHDLRKTLIFDPKTGNVIGEYEYPETAKDQKIIKTGEIASVLSTGVRLEKAIVDGPTLLNRARDIISPVTVRNSKGEIIFSVEDCRQYDIPFKACERVETEDMLFSVR